MNFDLCSDRASLCKLWRAIILRDEAAMKKHSAALGVEGEDSLSCIQNSLMNDSSMFLWLKKHRGKANSAMLI